MGKGEQDRSMIRSFDVVIARLEVEDLDARPVECLGDDLVEFEEVSRRFEAERSRRLGAFDDRDGHKILGFTSPIAFLKDTCRISASRAKRLVGMARAARRFQATFLSWKHSQISTDQAQLLF